MRFFLHIRKFYCTFAPVMSPRFGIMSYRVGNYKHNKGVIIALCLALRTWKIHKTSKTLQHFDVLGICISISVHTNGVCIIVHIGVDSVLLVQMFRQFQGLVKRNSNSAVPLFLYLFMHKLKRITVNLVTAFCRLK